MLHITLTQMQALRGASLRNFEQQFMAYLKARYPGYTESQGEAGMRALLVNCQLKADTAQIGTEQGIVTVAELTIRYGAGFQLREPWAQYLFSAYDVSATERITRLRSYL